MTFDERKRRREKRASRWSEGHCSTGALMPFLFLPSSREEAICFNVKQSCLHMMCALATGNNYESTSFFHLVHDSTGAIQLLLLPSLVFSSSFPMSLILILFSAQDNAVCSVIWPLLCSCRWQYFS